MDVLIGFVLLAFVCVCAHGAFLIVQDRQRDWDEKNKKEKDN